MKTITGTDLQNLRKEIDQALEALGKKYDIKFRAGNASYTGTNATFKLEIATKGEGGEVITKEAADFKIYAERFGVKPEDLGKEIDLMGRKFKLVGILPKSRKFPFSGKDLVDGKSYKLPENAVVKALGYQLRPSFF